MDKIYNIVCVTKEKFRHIREIGVAVLNEDLRTITFGGSVYTFKSFDTGLDGKCICLHASNHLYSNILLYTDTPTSGHTPEEIRKTADKAIELETFGFWW